MGEMFCYEAALSRPGTVTGGPASAPAPYTLDAVDEAFAMVRQVKYSQTVRLGAAGAGGRRALPPPSSSSSLAAAAALPGAPADAPTAASTSASSSSASACLVSVTPFCSGHTVGGSLWRVTVDGEDVVYAPAFAHRPDRHLNPTALATLTRPALLLLDGAGAAASLAKKDRDGALLEAILRTLRGGGSVLLPVDAAGRVLELLLALDAYWGLHRLGEVYPLVLLSAVGPNTIGFAQSELEWMSDSLARAFDHTQARVGSRTLLSSPRARMRERG